MAHYAARFNSAERTFWEAERAVLHFVTKAGMEVTEGSRIHFTTADPMQCKLTREFGGQICDEDFVGGCADELLKAMNERDARIEAIRQESDYDAVWDEKWAHVDDSTDALNAIEAYPVTGVGDLLCKVELMKGEESRDGGAGSDIDQEVLLTDLRRIVGARQ
jgi:hypothetical protein